MLKSIYGFLAFCLLVTCGLAFAGFQGFNSAQDLKLFSAIKCGSGLTCSNVGAGKMQIAVGSAGVSTFTNFGRGMDSLTGGTSTAGVATTLFMTQVQVHSGATITGIAINNAATVGTNKYIVALFDYQGKVVATSALAGVTTASASVYQKVPFTAPVLLSGASAYWIGLYINGTTDAFYTLPASKAGGGLAGTVTGQTFGTVVAVTPPTTFTAGAGPIAYTY